LTFLNFIINKQRLHSVNQFVVFCIQFIGRGLMDFSRVLMLPNAYLLNVCCKNRNYYCVTIENSMNLLLASIPQPHQLCSVKTTLYIFMPASKWVWVIKLKNIYIRADSLRYKT